MKLLDRLKGMLPRVKGGEPCEASSDCDGWGFGEGERRHYLDVPWSFWQEDRSLPLCTTQNSVVEACVSAISQTLAMLPIRHLRENELGGNERITTSAASRVLRYPNPYQTRSDFVLNMMRSLLLTGNAYALAKRNDRFEINELFPLPPRQAHPYVDPDTQEIWYSVGMTEFVRAEDLEFDDARWMMVPQRDMLHVRLHTPHHPLIGETPLTAAAYAVEGGASISKHNWMFFKNMSRPSGVLSTDLILTSEQVQLARKLWNEQSKGLNTGGVPILSAGLKWLPMSMTSVDAAIVESAKLSAVEIARVFRVPLAVIGEMGGATFNNVEALMRHWISTGLGFQIEHFELALSRLFRLPADEAIAMETDYLLRTDFKARIDALVKATQGGIYSPNEARRREGLPEVEHGEEPRVQMQVVPLSYAEAEAAAKLASINEPPPAPEQVEDDEPGPADEGKALGLATDAAKREIMRALH